MIDFNTELSAATNVSKVLKEAGAKDQRDALKLVPFEKLVILKDFNVREHDSDREARVRAIADSLKEVGYLPTQPMEVFVNDKGEIIVVEGHTRYDGILLAKSEGAQNLDMIPTLAHKPGTSMRDLTVNMVAANAKERLSPLGMSLIAKRLTTTFQESEAQAAKSMGVSPKYIKDLLLLASIPMRARELIIAKSITATLVIELFKEHGAEKAMQIIEESLGSVAADAEGKKVVRKKNTTGSKKVKTPDEIKTEAIKEAAEAMFQLICLVLEIDENPDLNLEQKKEAMEPFMDKLDIIRVQVNTKAEVAAAGSEEE